MEYLKTKEMTVKDSNDFETNSINGAKDVTNGFVSLGIVAIITIGVALYFARNIYPKPRIVVEPDKVAKTSGMTLKRTVNQTPSGYLE